MVILLNLYFKGMDLFFLYVFSREALNAPNLSVLLEEKTLI